MSSTPPAALETPEEERRTTYLELFFDLVLVFAITQLASMLHDVGHEGHGHAVQGWLEVGLLTAMIWWLWSQFAWLGSSVQLDAVVPRMLMLSLTGLMLVAAITLPAATAVGLSVFGVAYALIKFGALALYRIDAAADAAHSAALSDYTRKAALAPVLVFVGAFLEPNLRMPVWTVAVFIEIAGAFLVGRRAFRLSPTHFSERHALVLIIVLGEALVALGGKAVATERALLPVLGLLGGFSLVAALWWSYFAWAFGSTEGWLRGKGRPFASGDIGAASRMARDAFTFGHFPLVAGVIAMAVALKDLAAQPLAPWNFEARVAMSMGLVLYLGGFVAVVLRGNGHLLRERIVALAVMVATSLFAPFSAGVVAVMLSGELIVAILLEVRRWQRLHPST